MAKYIKNYLTVSAATEATDILSPNVTYIQDREKLLMKDVGDDKELEIVLDGSGEPKIQEKPKYDYLTFTCLEDGGISMTNYEGNTPNIEYSLNGGKWTRWEYSNISLTAGNVVKMRGNNPNGIGLTYYKYSKFVMAGSINASGNIMSLIDGQKDGTKIIPGEYCFMKLFRGCTSLKTCPELPATTLMGCCYYGLFFETGIIDASNLILPAKTMTCVTFEDTPVGCYHAMFRKCENLTSAPALPATTLASSCYQYMFYGCTSLTSAPALPATSLASSCYSVMFYGCSSLTTAPELPATTLVDFCYEGMFSGCSSLTSAPELPATTLAEGCYYGMFHECSSLNNIKCLATSGQGDETYEWVSGVSQTGTFVKAEGAVWTRDEHGIPDGWTVIDA